MADWLRGTVCKVDRAGFQWLSSARRNVGRCKQVHIAPRGWRHAVGFALTPQWLDEHLLAAVAHGQVAPTLPRRLRPYFVPGRRRLGLLRFGCARRLLAR
jgi:hypothetical protein